MKKEYSEEELQKIMYSEPEELSKRLKQWCQNPQSQPEIEYYYKNYLPKGKDLPRPKEKWEKDMDVYVKLMDEAMALEKSGDIDSALNIYLKILDMYEPIGTSYYENPIRILEKKRHYNDAISICEKALANPKLKDSKNMFQKLMQKLRGNHLMG